MLSSLSFLRPYMPGYFSSPAANRLPEPVDTPLDNPQDSITTTHSSPQAPEIKLSATDRMVIRTIAAGYLRMPRIPARWRGFLSPDAYQKMTGLPMEKASFSSVDGIPLKGYWFPLPNQPKDSGKTVILGHGYCANAGNMLPLIRPLHDAGYHVFLFDFRAHGNSGGEKTSIGYHEGKDLAAAVGFLKENYPKQTEEINYLGHSMGAAAYLMAPKSLEKHPAERQKLIDHLNRVILDSSYEVIKPSEDPYVAGYLEETLSKSRMSPALWLNPTKRWLQHIVKGFESQSAAMMDLPAPLNQLYPAELYKKHPEFQTKPLLLLHGQDDTRTAFTNSEAIFNTLTAIADTGHPFVESIHFVPLEADHFVTDWKPAHSKSAYKSILRDKERYIQSIQAFLAGKQPAHHKPPLKGAPAAADSEAEQLDSAAGPTPAGQPQAEQPRRLVPQPDNLASDMPFAAAAI